MGAPMLGFIFLPLLLVVLCWGQRWEGETVAGAEEGAGVSWGPEVWGPKESVPLTFWHPFSLCFYEKDAAELSSLMPSLPSSPVRFPPLLMWNRSLFYIIIHSVFSLGGLIHSELDPPHLCTGGCPIADLQIHISGFLYLPCLSVSKKPRNVQNKTQHLPLQACVISFTSYISLWFY